MTTTINTRVGDLFSVTKGHIVHGCNAHGVMGSGVALAVKTLYPGAYADYRSTYEKHGLRLGRAYPWEENKDLIIWNAITQEHFGSGRRFVSYDAIETCFAEIDRVARELQLEVDPHIHIPLIGADRGGGSWKIISTIIEETVSVPVTLWMLPHAPVAQK